MKKDSNSAIDRLEEGRKALMHTDPLDAKALSCRGYVAGTLFQVTELQKYNEEAANLFTQAVRLDPSYPGALKGLAVAKHYMGDLNAEIDLYLKTVKLAPKYASAHHDLAIAYEEKMQTDPGQKTQWCRKALREWQTFYQLAPNDPGFSEDYIVRIGKHITNLKGECGERIPKKVKS